MIDDLVNPGYSSKKDPFYVIVHADGAKEDSYHKRDPNFRKVLRRIEGIKMSEDYIEIDNYSDPKNVPEGIPYNRKIKVCGFFRDICVKDQKDALRCKGYDAEIARKASYKTNPKLISISSNLDN